MQADGDGVLVTGAGDEALFRGLLTVAALSSQGELAALEISDGPHFAWRGLSLDVVRRWFPVEDVERVIDLLAIHKFNVLHLHLSDMQGWRFVVPGYDVASGDGHYTAADLDHLVAYAAARQVTIVPEVDMPGHVSPTVGERIGVEVATGPHPLVRYLEWHGEGVPAFVQAVLDELVARFDAPYLHIGGDEAFGDPIESYVAFVRAAVAEVRARGRRVLGWQETSRAGILGGDDRSQLWIADRDRFDADKARQDLPEQFHPFIPLLAQTFAESTGDAARLGEAGVPVIVSSSDPFYLDRKPSEDSTDAGQQEQRARLGHPGYEATPSTDVLRWDPTLQADIAEAGLTVAGVEAALWCESVTSFDDAATLLLPRLGLVAQVCWGGPLGGDVAEADVLAAARAQADAWDALGFSAYYRSAGVFG